MVYTADQILIKGLEIEEIINLHIQCQVGQHSFLTMTGYLKEGTEEKTIYHLREQERITVQLKKKGTIFSGVLTNLSIQGEGNVSKVTLEAKSLSWLMDRKKKSRSFQRTSMTYQQLVAKIVQEYPKTNMKFCVEDKPIGEIAVQYNETDWEFLSRMCSELHAPLTCRLHGEQTEFYIGVPNVKKEEFTYQKKSFQKQFGQYDYWMKQGKKVNDSDFFIMTIKTNHLPEIFESISYKGKAFVIKSYEYRLKKGVLSCYCDLQKKEGILAKRKYPMHIIGIALSSKVLEISGTQVKVHLDIDKDGSEDVHWFDFSTLSASKDGSGWYYMPEKGDQVRIYFPSKHTKDAIAISAVNTYEGEMPESKKGTTSTASASSSSSSSTSSAESSDKMSNPSTKYLSNTNGQEMKMGEEGIFLSCAGGSAVVQIGNDGTLTLQSAQTIEIQAENNISIEAEEDLIVHGSEMVAVAYAKGGQIQLTKDGTLKIQGTEVKID